MGDDSCFPILLLERFRGPYVATWHNTLKTSCLGAGAGGYHEEREMLHRGAFDFKAVSVFAVRWLALDFSAASTAMSRTMLAGWSVSKRAGFTVARTPKISRNTIKQDFDLSDFLGIRTLANDGHPRVHQLSPKLRSVYRSSKIEG